MSEQLNAGAASAAGVGLPMMLWGLDQLKVHVPSWLAVLILVASVICVLVALVLWLHLFLKWLGIKIPWYVPARQVPFDDAARRVYEAAEKANIINLMLSKTSSSQSKLFHFKMLLMVDDEVSLFGVKPPSTKPRRIPKSELVGSELYPSETDPNGLDNLLPLDHPPAYINVMVLDLICAALSRST